MTFQTPMIARNGKKMVTVLLMHYITLSCRWIAEGHVVTAMVRNTNHFNFRYYYYIIFSFLCTYTSKGMLIVLSHSKLLNRKNIYETKHLLDICFPRKRWSSSIPIYHQFLYFVHLLYQIEEGQKMAAKKKIYINFATLVLFFQKGTVDGR